MMRRLLGSGVAGLVVVACFAACGSGETATSTTSGTGTGGATSTSSTTGTGASSTTGTSSTTSTGGSGGSGGHLDLDGGSDAPADAPSDAAVVTMPGLFDCNGCLCDGSTHYCEHISGGEPPPPPGPPPEPVCSDDGGTYDPCKPLPSACLGNVSCGCSDTWGGPCKCSAGPSGLIVTCVVP